MESDGRLQVKDSRYILGEVLKSKGDSIEFIFNLKNCADSLIIIKKVDVSCGCISIIESPDSIFPNMNAKLKGVVNIKNQHGHLNKSIFVNYGRRRNSILLLRIIGDIIE